MDLLNLFFSFRGRTSRGDFWYATLVVFSIFVVGFVVFETLFGRASTWILYPPLYWSLFAIAIKRYHDIGRSGWWLLLLLIPIIGPAWVLFSTGFRKGQIAENRFGAPPGKHELDYKTRPECTADLVVQDITGLTKVRVRSVARPRSVEELQRLVRESTGPISIAGAGFSMGGQVASPDSLHVDMRSLNQILDFVPAERRVRVQAGIRWCDLQRFLDPHDLAVKIMQTYANFSVGGTLSVNAHGRYVGQGPAILSVRSIAVVMADGEIRQANPAENSELFYGVIGGYGGLGVIVEAELEVVPNTRVMCVSRKMPAAEYLEYFKKNVRDDAKAVFHNADVYPPHYKMLRAQTWVETDKPVTQTNRLMALRSDFPLDRYLFWAISETPFGKWRREFLFDPLFFFRAAVHWRNYEASYDVACLEPTSRKNNTYVLQEYFVPIDRFDAFLADASEILQRHKVNAINISVRHARKDPGSLLAWARDEVFAFVLYYKQCTQEHACAAVGVWTRELIDAALKQGGTYYLPYELHGTPEQFRRAYPRIDEFLALKRRLDPKNRFRNSLWDKYAPALDPAATICEPSKNGSEFRSVYADVKRRDAFYKFLQNVFHLYPEDRFHTVIQHASTNLHTDKEIYEKVQADLPGIKTALSMVTYALPALLKQKREMARQTLEILGDRKSFDGYVEIGTTGRYVAELRKHVQFTGPLFITNDVAPGGGPGEWMERGQLKPLGTFHNLDYQPLDSKGIAPGSIDMVTSFIGLHHCPTVLLDEFVRSIHRVLRPGGVFILRDHDAGTPAMAEFCSLVHVVFNAGLGASWADNAKEFKQFRGAEAWSGYLVERGFRDLGKRLLQANDPSDNTLMGFTKE